MFRLLKPSNKRVKRPLALAWQAWNAGLIMVSLSVSFPINANSVSMPLTVNAYLIQKHFGNGIRIEADKYNFSPLYLWTTGKFQELTIPFKVFASQDYQLEVNQFYFRCSTESAPAWVDRADAVKVYFDKQETPLASSSSVTGTQLILPESSYLKPIEGGVNSHKNPMPNEGWDAWYRSHQFDITHESMPQTNEQQTCLGMISVMATTPL